MITIVPNQVPGTVVIDGKETEGEVDSTQLFEVFDVIQVNTRFRKFMLLGSLIRAKRGWMSVVADEDKVVEHRLKREALERITESHRELAGQARGSRLV